MSAAEFSFPVRHEVAERSGGMCEVMRPRRCDGRAVEFHHRRPRGMGGTSRRDSGAVTNCLHVCRACHRWLESDRAIARELGFLVSQHVDPGTVPVCYRFGRAELLPQEVISS